MLPELLLTFVLIVVGHGIHFCYRLSAIVLHNVALSNPYRQELAWDSIFDTAKKSARSAFWMSVLFASVVGFTEICLALLESSFQIDRAEATEMLLGGFVFALAFLVFLIGAIGVWFKVMIRLQTMQPAPVADEETLFVSV